MGANTTRHTKVLWTLLKKIEALQLFLLWNRPEECPECWEGKESQVGERGLGDGWEDRRRLSKGSQMWRN